ncbi:hypothetical protein CEE44_01330 [Candidatus Woesearchaeota archaeon B3_Woes]|nr:MAG: hypothetical protein CEE44_01330 [Candidatus Woesearchaeota archaeon B3_Woes]
MELQEIIVRGRFIFNNAPKRLEVYKQINGRQSAKDIAKKVGKPLVPTLNDLQKIKDIGLIKPKKDVGGKQLQKNNSIIYEKIPLAKQISISYFENPIKKQKQLKQHLKKKITKENKRITTISVPFETGILDICKSGENQLYEFKAAGTEVKKLTKEIAAMLNTKMGGIILYGVDDDGAISGTDKTSQQMDQPLQNCVKDNIDPSPIIKLIPKKVMGQDILLIVVPPWDKNDVYHFSGKVLLRKGTNVFTATSGESKKLHNGEYVI